MIHHKLACNHINLILQEVKNKTEKLFKYGKRFQISFLKACTHLFSFILSLRLSCEQALRVFERSPLT